MGKSFKHYSSASLLAALKREIYYPSATFKGYLFRYISTLLLTVPVMLLSTTVHSESMAALLLVMAVVGVAWVGGLGPSLFSALLAIAFMDMFFFYPHIPTITFL